MKRQTLKSGTNSATKKFTEVETVKVWDIFVRMFHWSLVLALLILFASEDDFLNLHSYAGYTVLVLVISRVVWGFIGTYHARFSNFVTTPKVAINYLKDEIEGDSKRYIGHNPAGGIMIVAMIVTLLIAGFTGLASIATEGQGPLANTFVANFSGEILGEIHELITGVVLFLAIFHIGGVIFSSFMEEENLVKSMFNGRKRKEVN